MRRREFISLLGGVAAAASGSRPRAARAQQAAMPVVGFLHSGSPEQNAKRLAAFHKGLSEAGFVEGKNVALEYRWSEGQDSRLQALAADLIQRHVPLIAAPNTPAALAAKAATAAVSIVFATGADPVALGLVASLNRPGGNVTGATSLNADVAAKRLGVLRELVPQAAGYFTLINPTSALAQPFTKDLEAGAASLGISIGILRASTEREIDAVIVTAGSTPAALAAKAATTTIPIVFGAGADPVELGLVPSLNRPGGNVTGVTSLNAEIAAKRLGMFRELVPQAAHYFALVNPTSALADLFIRDLQVGAATVGAHIDILRASTDPEIEAAFASLPQQPGNVLVFGPDAFFFIRRAQIAALMARHAIPSIQDARDYVEAGGLMSYGADFLNVMQLAGGYTGRILKGEKPADLPVMLSTKYELVINLKTAKALGLTVPDKLLALADEVIE